MKLRDRAQASPSRATTRATSFRHSAAGRRAAYDPGVQDSLLPPRFDGVSSPIPGAHGPTQLPDPVHRTATPSRLIEPALAMSLPAAGALAAWGVAARTVAWIPLAAVLTMGVLALVWPGGAVVRTIRGLVVLTAASAIAVAEPALVPLALAVVLASAAIYPALVVPAAGRLLTAACVGALGLPLAYDVLTAESDPADALLGGVDPGVVAGRLALVGGMAIAAVLGWSAGATRRALTATASLAERRGTAARRATAELTHASSHDVVTGLPNRDAMLREVTVALTREAVMGGRVALIVLDIDRYATLVDSFGPTVGDDVVRQVGRRLRAARPAADLVARIGRHQFAVVTAGLPDGMTPEDCSSMARRMTALLEGGVRSGGRELSITCSIGIAVSDEGLDNADALTHAADEAMRAARQVGRSRWATFNQAMRAHNQTQAALEIELREAVRQRRIDVAFQPVLALDEERGNHIVAVEALARWTRDDGSAVPPMRFIPMADDLGLGVTLGLQVIDRALDVLAEWREAGAQVEQMWVNVAPSQLADPEFATMVSARLAARGIPPASLVVEIGASCLVDSEQAHSTLGMLRSLGIGVALDDFGRSGTSLAALRHLPIGTLKLDYQLATDLGRYDAVPRAMTALAHELGLRVVVEGVETLDQLRGAQEIGADLAQGYSVARPAMADDVLGMLPRTRMTVMES